MKKHIAIIIILSLIALWPFFKQGFFETDDGEWMIIRFTAFYRTLKAGQIPVRFTDQLNNNYGYPVMNFLYPGPFYAAVVPKAIGFNYVSSIKLIFIISTIVSSFGMYIALSQLFKPFPSFTGALIYLYTPYRMMDLYIRGSLGECFAFATIPLLFYCILKFAKGKEIFTPLISLATALLITSHNVLAAIFLPILIVIAFILVKKRILKIIASFILGIFIASFFWIPAIYDLKYVRLSVLKVSDPTKHLIDMRDIISRWWFNDKLMASDRLVPEVGIITVVAIIIGLILLFAKKERSVLLRFILITSVLSVFLTTKYSTYLWQSFQPIQVIQFPWRLISVTVFMTPIIIAFTLNRVKTKFLGVIIILISISSTIIYTLRINFIDKKDPYYTANVDSTTVKDEYMPLWVNEKPPKPVKKIESQTASIENVEIRESFYKAAIRAERDSIINVNTIYFPGWYVKVNGKNTAIDYSNREGIITFKLPSGYHNVIIKYSKTPLHLISESISLIAFFGAISYFYYLWRKQGS